MTGPTLQEARVALAGRLSGESLRHCERVAELSRDLAERFGSDARAAELAGLLHDWSRDESAAELLGYARDHGIQVCDVDLAVPYLLHATVAASQVREAFPAIAPVIVDAIASHTVGGPVMTDLMRIVYIADTIEPARSFDGVGKLRTLAVEPSTTLAQLFFACYRRSLLHLVESGRRIHPETVRAWNSLVAEARS